MALEWLDAYEQEHSRVIRRHLPKELDLLEEAISLVQFGSEELALSHPEQIISEMKDCDKSEIVCGYVNSILITTATRRLCATRTLLISSYYASAMGALRDMIESLYYADICRQSMPNAKRWLNDEYIERKTAIKAHQSIESARKGYLWGALSSIGVHPCFCGKIIDRPIVGTTIGEFRKDDYTQTDNWKEARFLEMLDLVGMLVLLTTNFAHDVFLRYLDSQYPWLFDKDPKIRERLESFSEGYQAFITARMNSGS